MAIKLFGEKVSPKEFACGVMRMHMCPLPEDWELQLVTDEVDELTDRERQLVDDQVRKIWARIDKIMPY